MPSQCTVIDKTKQDRGGGIGAYTGYGRTLRANIMRGKSSQVKTRQGKENVTNINAASSGDRPIEVKTQ